MNPTIGFRSGKFCPLRVTTTCGSLHQRRQADGHHVSVDDLDFGDVPNYPACLTRLEVAGERLEALYWWCPSCEIAMLH
jgi:hypothetical protein